MYATEKKGLTIFLSTSAEVIAELTPSQRKWQALTKKNLFAKTTISNICFRILFVPHPNLEMN